MSDTAGLFVRRAARHEVCLTIRFRIAPEHDEAVRFTSASGHRDGIIEADVVDLGFGGVGFVSSVFLPKNAHLIAEVFPLGEGQVEPLFQAQLKVMRVLMTDRRPAYLVGTSFLTMDDGLRRAVAGVIGVPADSPEADV